MEFFYFCIKGISGHFLLAATFAEKSVDGLTEVPLCIISCFTAFKILSSSLTFDTLITMCLGVGLFGFICGPPWAAWIQMSVNYPRLGTVVAPYFFK